MGIYAPFSNSKGGQITLNRINDNSSITVNTAGYGIFLRQSENWLVCDNRVNKGTIGLGFEGDCDPCFVKGNIIQNNDTGLRISSYAATIGAIGEQKRHANTWLTTNYPGFAAQCTSDPFYSLFKIENSSPEKLPTATDLAPSSFWFSLDPGPINGCGNAQATELTGLDLMVINDNPTGPYTWEWKSRLMLKLIQNPDLRPVGSLIEAYYNSNLTSTTGKLAQVENMVAEAMRMPDAKQDSLDDLMLQRASLFEQVVDLENSWTDSTDTYSPSIIAVKKALFNDIKSASVAIASIKSQHNLAIQAPLVAAATFNQAIATQPNSFEDYQKQLNALLIKQATGATLNEADLTAALNIADATYGTSDKTERIANSLLPPCQALNTFRASESKAEHLETGDGIAGFTISPNPASESIDLQFGIPFTGKVIIINLAGQTMLLQKVANETTSLSLDTSKLPNGIYFVQSKSEFGITHATHRLVISR